MVRPTAGFEVTIDRAHGGRWTSLVDPLGREWLWCNENAGYPDVAAIRNGVQPGQAFVDAGGVEECFPTITGVPDHGDVWCRPWVDAGGGEMTCVSGDFQLSRTVSAAAEIVVDYRLEGPPGAHFIWAFHALLDPVPGMGIEAPPAVCRAWTAGGYLVETIWPAVLASGNCSVLADNDGSAVFCVLDGVDDLTVRQGRSSLRFQLRCAAAPVSVGVWRNLGGFPQGSAGTYRSFGVEPMLGRAPALAEAGDDEVAVLPPSGELTWQLRISVPPAS